MKVLIARFKSSVAVVAVAAAGVLGLSIANAPEALAACTGSIVYSPSSTTVTNTSQCYQVQASIKGYVPGIGVTRLYGEVASNKSVVHLPSGSNYMRNGMGLKGSPSAGWSWSYWVY